MSMVAIKSKDKKQRQLVADLSMIKDEVKVALLKSYLYLCQIRHSLAFFQWRDAFHANSNKETLVELFENNARFLYRKSHVPDAPYSYIKDTSLKDVIVVSHAANPS